MIFVRRKGEQKMMNVEEEEMKEEEEEAEDDENVATLKLKVEQVQARGPTLIN